MIDNRSVYRFRCEGFAVTRRLGLGVLGALILAACSAHNPAVCCTTAEQCFAVGLDQMYACADGLVCDPTGTCVVGCQTAADCSGAMPFCEGNLCNATCATNADCTADPARPFCESDGACGECVTSDTCPAHDPTCDATTHMCRACSTNADCASDECATETGTCGDASSIAYVSDSGTDTGTCAVTSPCRTFAFVGTVLGGRTWVHVLGAAFSAGSASNVIPTGVATIDSSSAVITNDGSSPIFTTAGAQNVTLRTMTIGASGRSAAAISMASSTVTAQHVQLLQPFNVGAGTLFVIEDSTLGGTATNTSAGTTTIRRCQLQIGVATTGGTLTYQRNSFNHPTARALEISGSPVTTGAIGNSIFISNGATASVIDLGGAGVTVQFVTIVDLQATAIPPITCFASTGGQVDSSILGWNTTALPNCQTSYSLFNGSTAGGATNLAGNISSFFVDLAGQDFHLSATSPALHAGDPTSTESEDFDGNPRPTPSATPRDVGAYESPN
jgi:hypothetical protein